MGIAEQVRSFIRESFFVEQFEDGDSFLRAGIIDSMGMLQLVAFVEETFGFDVADEDLVPANFDSLASLTAYVEQKRKRQTA